MLFKLLDKIASLEIVVTNRLHCMIFCVITQTPCVVLPIKGDKIMGVYYWLKDSNFIRCLEDYDLNNIISNIEELKNITPNDINLKKYFNPIIDIISSVDKK